MCDSMAVALQVTHGGWMCHGDTVTSPLTPKILVADHQVGDFSYVKNRSPTFQRIININRLPISVATIDLP